MGEPQSEFTPDEFDRLEDALEGLEEREDWSEFDDAPALRERLESYREVMSVSREAFAMEEVPAGLLDAVMAQAREEAIVVKAPEGEPQQRGGWGRWLVPVLGLVGGAAAVLFAVQLGRQMNEGPDAQRAPALAAAEEVERTEAEADVAADNTAGRSLSSDLDDALALAEEAPDKEREELPEDAELASDDAPTPREGDAKPTPTEPKADPAPPVQKPGYGGGGGVGSSAKGTKNEVALGGEADEGALQLDKDELYDLLAEADKKRRQGRCGAAESRYKQVLVGGPDPMAKARAQAGLGLCAEYNGDLKGADAFFSQAKAGYTGISGWIETERAKMPAATETKKSKSKAKKQAREPLPDAVDSL